MVATVTRPTKRPNRTALKEAREHRLFGKDGQGGGGLSDWQVFHPILTRMLDDGPQSFDTLVAVATDSLRAKSAQVADTWRSRSYAGLTEDVLALLADRGFVQFGEDGWAVTDKLRRNLGKVMVLRRASKEGNHRAITLHDKEERERVSQAAIEGRELQAMYSDLRNDRAFEVKVRGERTHKQFRIHPLALGMPPMPFAEFKDLAQNIKRDGVAYPVIVNDGLVVDGRHRLAIASALGQPVSVEPYRGSEDVAAFVVSVNKDRHGWSKLERALIVLDYYYPQAKREAEANQSAAQGWHHGSAPIGADLGRALEKANKRSGGMSSVRTLERLLPVLEAPKTRQRILTGNIKSAVEAYKVAMRERGVGDPPADAPALPKSLKRYLGQAKNFVMRGRETMESGEQGDAPFAEVEELMQTMESDFATIRKLWAEREQAEA